MKRTLSLSPATEEILKNVAYSKTYDFFGNGKARDLLVTEPGHAMRRTFNYTDKAGNAQWTLQGEYVVIGARGAVWTSYRHSQHTSSIRFINAKTFKEETIVNNADLLGVA